MASITWLNTERMNLFVIYSLSSIARFWVADRRHKFTNIVSGADENCQDAKKMGGNQLGISSHATKTIGVKGGEEKESGEALCGDINLIWFSCIVYLIDSCTIAYIPATEVLRHIPLHKMKMKDAVKKWAMMGAHGEIICILSAT
ncbi:hypothetical protein ACJX0J_027177 [Zea mays]